jgi:hypothetical protein
VKQDNALVIDFAPHRVGLCVVVSGAGTYANTLAYWQAIVGELRARHPAGLLLIDKTTGKPLSVAEWTALVKIFVGQGLEQVRIAHVKPYGLQRIEYCELCAREAGIDARVFTDEAEADLWLRYGERTQAM